MENRLVTESQRKFRFRSLLLLLAFLLIGGNQIQARQSASSRSAAYDQAPAQISGGVFIPRNGGIEGRIGLSHVFFHEDAGGVMSVVDGEWSTFNSLAKLDMVFSVKASGTELPVEVRQSFDKNPRILFLERTFDQVFGVARPIRCPNRRDLLRRESNA